MDPTLAARTALVAACARLAAHGLIVATEGNASVRLDGTDILVTPAGRRKDALGPADLVVVGLVPDPARDAAVRPRPTSDLAVHRAIYRACPDVRAVVHAHPPAALALTLAGEAPDPSLLPETATLLGALPVVPFAPPGSDELAERIATTLAGASSERPARAVLLERHGVVAVGASVEDALDRLELADLLCRVWRDARLLGWRPDRG
ncbi:MAG TPA: class II aldolase/adducin family protein [Candidatus Binatia bacterium]|nr:class II aldolase/adducin family protein [Candidatus Binatia bacterium]